MSERRLLLGAIAGVARRDAALFWSYRLRALSQTVAVFFSLALFYYVSRLVRVDAFRTGDDYFAFVAVGIMTLHVLTAAVGVVPVALRQELVAGTFERFAVSPLGATAGIVAMLAWPMAFALVLTSLQLLLAVPVFGLDIRWSTAPLALPAALLGALSFAPFALLVSSVIMLIKQVSGGVSFITTGMAFVGGFFFPTALLPGWLEWMSEVQPFTPTLELLRHLLVGTPLTDPAGTDLLRMAGFAVVLFPISLAALSWSVDRARRRGTLIEY